MYLKKKKKKRERERVYAVTKKQKEKKKSNNNRPDRRGEKRNHQTWTALSSVTTIKG